MKKAFIAVLIILSLVSCGDKNTLGEKQITKEQFGAKWPFTVSEGTLRCVQYEAEDINPEMIQGVIFEVNGKIYGVNGVSKTWGKKLGYAAIEEIWADDTIETNKLIKAGVPKEQAKIKMDIGVILEEGKKLCN